MRRRLRAPFGLPRTANLAARGSSNGARKPSSNACASSNGVRIDFSSFLLRSWKARTSIFVSQCSVSYTSHEVSTERARVAKNHENRRFSASKSSPGASKSSSGGPWRAKNRARICEEPPNFLKLGRTSRSERGKSACCSGNRRPAPEIPGAPIGNLR